MYSLSISEIEAWIHSFNGADLNHLIYNIGYYQLAEYTLQELIDTINSIPEYKHYILLNNLFKKYRYKFDNIYQIIKHKPNAISIIKRYFLECYNIKLQEPFNLSPFIEHIWLTSIQKIIKRMQKIHYQNLIDKNL